MVQRAFFDRGGVKSSPDFVRVQGLPVRNESSYIPNLVEAMTAILRTPSGTQTLRDVQARALWDLGHHQKGFYPIRVGGGKTLISFLAPRVVGAQRPLLILPASLIEKTEREWRNAAKDWRIAKHLTFISYELLGRVSGAARLDLMQPDMILADECHKLKNLRAAVTRRVSRYMAQHPKTIFVPMSGTIMKKSIRDFAHLLEWSHGTTTPLPLHVDALIEWSEALDEGVNPLQRRDPGVLLDLFPGGFEDNGAYGDDNNRRARRVFQMRANATSGIVSADAKDDYTGSLQVQALEYKPNEATENNFHTLRETMCRPDGWALTEAMQVWAVARQLALGLHYIWWDDKRFKECLRKENENNHGPAITAILKSIGLGTVSGINAAMALEVVRRKQHQGSETDMVSRQRNTLNFGESATGYATSAAKNQVSPEQAESYFAWTTTTSPEKLEAYFASVATVESGCWETLLRVWPALLPILQEGAKAAGAPEEWLLARKQWAVFVRDFLASPRSEAMGIDSEFAVMNAVLDHKIVDEYGLLAEWRRIRPTFDVNSVPVWHDETALGVCAKWLGGHSQGICWVEHRHFAKELSRRTGVPYFGAKGLAADGAWIEDANGPVIASIAANSAGRNLQFKWCENLVTAPAADSERWEQLIGRTHREGQPADSVSVDVLCGCREHLESIPRALTSSDVKGDLLGFSQKLKIADITWPEMTGRSGMRWA